MVPKMSGYVKRFSKCMFFKKNDELFKKYTEIRDKVSDNIKKGFDSELVYNEKYQKKKSKIISYRWEINTSLHDGGMPKDDFHCICCLEILVNSAFKVKNNIYKCF